MKERSRFHIFPYRQHAENFLTSRRRRRFEGMWIGCRSDSELYEEPENSAELDLWVSKHA